MTAPRRSDRPHAQVEVLDAGRFAPHLDVASEIYGRAMERSADLVVQRRSLIAGHLQRDAFVAVVAMADDRLAGFGYGYPGLAGDWWHDVVAGAVGREAAAHWLSDDFEVAELHVDPDWQGNGFGRELLHTLLSQSTNRTAVLSTHDRESRARQLYRSFGFVDLLRSFRFPASTEVYAILGREL